MIDVEGLDIGVIEVGAPDAPPVLCMHGFPDTPWTWRKIWTQLADSGRRVVAPFLPGYAPTGLLPGDDYSVDIAASAMLSLHEQVSGDERAAIVGHDWGATLAYAMVRARPDQFDVLVALSVPFTGGEALDLVSWSQMHRSWYAFLLALPDAEALVAADGMAFLDRLWSEWSPGYDSTDDLRRVKSSLAPPGHLAAALGYYRSYATSGDGRDRSPSLPVDVALSYIHGADDGCIVLDVVEAARSHAPHAHTHVVNGAGHFPQLERPDVVAEIITAALDRQ